ncbi:MAG TPA: AEC family transporter [Longimicrobiales bacterium]|nr:AEC family transporter [Longimicrobiales bacterium]
MTSLLDLVAPVFGLVALGFVAVRSSVLDTGGVRGLVAFVFNFALPVLLFRTMVGMEIPERIPWSVLVAFYVPALTIYALGMALARWGFGRPTHEQAIFGMASSFSNTVFLGIPIALPALGPDAALPVLLIVAFHSATFMPLTLALVHLGRGVGVSASEQTATLARSLVKDPIVMGILVGLAANLGSVALPGWLDRLAELLATAAMPCALFAMGASLAGSPAGTDGTAPWTLAAMKLVAHPLLVWVVAVPVLGLRGVWADAAVLMAAMPTGVNVYLFGARHDAAAPVAARTVLVATVASVATISAVLALLGR